MPCSGCGQKKSLYDYLNQNNNIQNNQTKQETKQDMPKIKNPYSGSYVPVSMVELWNKHNQQYGNNQDNK